MFSQQVKDGGQRRLNQPGQERGSFRGEGHEAGSSESVARSDRGVAESRDGDNPQGERPQAGPGRSRDLPQGRGRQEERAQPVGLPGWSNLRFDRSPELKRAR